MSKTNEFRQEVREVTNDTWYLKEGQEYTRATDKVILIHRKCGTEKAVTPKDFRYRGVHCRVCKETTENTRKYKSRRSGLTSKEFEQRVEDRFGSDYRVIVPYKNEKAKVKIKHLVCGKEFWVYPTNFVKEKHGCPSCASKRGRIAQLNNSNQIWNQETFVNRIKELTGDEYSVLGTYTKSIEKVKMKHNKCGNVFYMAPNQFINGGHRCPKCHLHERKTSEVYKKELFNTFGNEFILLSGYYNAHTKVLIKHNKCNHSYWVSPSSFMTRHGVCPYCRQSKGERIINYILVHDYSLSENRNFYYGYVLSNGLHLDFYIPKCKVAIEYDGKQHYMAIDHFGGTEQFKTQQKRDREKDKYCKECGIKLIRIPYTVNTYNDIKQILASYILPK